MYFLMLVETEEERDKLTRLFRKYERVLWRLAYDILRHEEDAEDCVQETFVVAATDMSRLDDVDSPRTKNFLITVVKNRAYNKRSEKLRHNEVEYCEVYDSVEMVASENDLLKRYIKTLPQKQQDILAFKFYQQMDNEDIAAALGMSEDSVRQNLKRALDKLRGMGKKEDLM